MVGAAFVVASSALVILWILATAALSALIAAVTAERVRREATLVNDHRATCFWWGLPTGFLMWLLIALFGQIGGVGDLVALVLLVFAAFALATGFAGVSLAVGSRLLNKADLSPPALVTAVGALTLGLAFLAPIAGQALLLYVASLSLGAFRLTWFGKWMRTQEAPGD